MTYYLCLYPCLGVLLLCFLVRNTCIQNSKSIRVRFHNLGYCEEESSEPVVPRAPSSMMGGADEQMERLMSLGDDE